MMARTMGIISLDCLGLIRGTVYLNFIVMYTVPRIAQSRPISHFATPRIAAIIHPSIVFQNDYQLDRLCGPFEKAGQKAYLKTA